MTEEHKRSCTAKEWIARRAAAELKDGQIVNLGIGLPSMIPAYLSNDIQITFQSENGMLGIDNGYPANSNHPCIVNAAGQSSCIKRDGSFFDSSVSFGMIRGGHIDITILGAYEVDEKGNLANWCIPGQAVSGMGGAMDCVTGAKKVIVTMQHTQNGKSKIREKCTLPLTACGKVNRIITEMAVIDVTPKGLVLAERNPQYTLEEILTATEAHLLIGSDNK